MKTKWLISVKDNTMDSVAKELKEIGVKDVEALDSIGVIVIVPGNHKIADIKKIEGVLSVEEERDISI
ncbi:nitrate reductase NapAB chaperone NapD [Flavobacterium sp. W4I14]|nr:nitrate reductase NapAB chaperone NapD [Flavobacterium sp. W4I14]